MQICTEKPQLPFTLTLQLGVKLSRSGCFSCKISAEKEDKCSYGLVLVRGVCCVSLVL